MAKYDKADLERRMHGAVESLKHDLAGLRTGRASAHLGIFAAGADDLRAGEYAVVIAVDAAEGGGGGGEGGRVGQLRRERAVRAGGGELAGGELA